MWPVSQAFLDELKKPVQQFRVRMDVLDTNFVPISGGVFYDVGFSSDATGILVDGAVDVDVTRQARRNFTATLINRHGEWSPNAEWSGTFYVDRLIRLWRGVVYGVGADTPEELVPIGTFFIDHADVVVERNMSVVILSGTDLWKKFNKHQFTAPFKWTSSTNINTVIEDVSELAGVTQLQLDPLIGRHTDEKTLNSNIMVEIGDTANDVLSKISTNYGLDIYFDPMGILVSQDMLNPADQEVVFRYLA